MSTPLSQFLDLPPELLTNVFENLEKRQDCASVALVDRNFHSFVNPLLYKWIAIHSWRKDCKEKQVKQLFDTLASRSDLAHYVEILELRDSPRWAFGTSEAYSFHDTVVKGLSHCINLKSFIWTRDGTLRDDFLDTIHEHCPKLTELEINGRSEPLYNPALLTRFTRLSKITIFMPDSSFASILPEWISATGSCLKSLDFICKTSSRITDNTLESLAMHAPNLEHLRLVGTARITSRGIGALAAAEPQLKSLALEAAEFDVLALSLHVMRHKSFRQLTSISITQPSHFSARDFFTSLNSVLESSPLEEFQIFRPGGEIRRPNALPDDFLKVLLLRHGSRLKKIAVQGLETSSGAIEAITRCCPNMEKLFLVLITCEIDELVTQLSRLSKLHTLHLLYSYICKNPIVPSRTDVIKHLLSGLSPTVKLFGCLTRVFEVNRTWVLESRDPVVWRDPPEITLQPYSGRGIPEAFLITLM